MYSSKIGPFLLFLIPFGLFSQTQEREPLSRILRTNASDTAILHLEMAAAEYDPAKNYAPFYLISRISAYDQTAIPNLVIKKTKLVENTQEAIIRQYFSSELSTTFKLESTPSFK